MIVFCIDRIPFVATRSVDFRKVHYQPDEEAYEALVAKREDWLEGQLELARLFLRMHKNAAYAGKSCSSIGQMASLMGYDAVCQSQGPRRCALRCRRP